MANEEVTREEIAAAINDVRRCQHHWLPESIEVIIAAASQSRPAPDCGQDACPFCGGDELNTYDNEYRSRAIARLNNIARGPRSRTDGGEAMTEPPRTLQERPAVGDLIRRLDHHASLARDGAACFDSKLLSDTAEALRRTTQGVTEHDKDMLIAGFKHDLAKVRAALAAQSQLLAEARETLEPFAKIADQHIAASDSYCVSVFLSDLRQARAILAKLKAATPPAEGDDG